jgi:hypothetical protein
MKIEVRMMDSHESGGLSPMNWTKIGLQKGMVFDGNRHCLFEQEWAVGNCSGILRFLLAGDQRSLRGFV